MANNTINQRNPSVDLSVQIFDRFYNYQSAINSVEYDAVLSYFKSVFKTTEQAKNFTTTFFRVSDYSGIAPSALLEQFKGKSGPDITFTFAFYLNTLQSPATMLGIGAKATPNYYIAHNIKQ